LNSKSPSTLRHWGLFSAWMVAVCLLFWKPLHILTQYALANDDGSHILVVPLIVIWLWWTERPRVDSKTALDLRPALLIGTPAAALAVLSFPKLGSPPDWALAGTVAALILLFFAGFVAIFGFAVARTSWFPFAFATFAMPLPQPLLDRVVTVLQWGSAAVAAFVFDLTGLPVLREGLIFRMPSFSIEVASECSGIRSSIALVILAVLIVHFSLTRVWKKIVFVAAGLLMMLVKNGVRIATLTLLAQYVNRNFLFGRLHHDGGIVFFLLGLALLVPLYWILRRGETASTVMKATPAVS
jgi:exosortase